jgi:hypothetical protein
MDGSGRRLAELDSDEWVRRTWSARCLTEPNGPGSPASIGTLILTNRRLLFAGGTRADEPIAVNFTEFTAARCERHGLSLNTLIVETSSSERFVFRTKRMACKQIEARSRMRSLAKG